MSAGFLDRTSEVNAASGELRVKSTDYCGHYVCKRSDRNCMTECWYCKYGKFGIETNSPSEDGICKYNYGGKNK